MNTIKATTQTFLKKEVVQASELLETQKVKVSPGKTYEILNYSEAEQGHYRVELNYGAGTWYLWSGHWQLPWEDNAEEAETHQSNFFTAENLKAIMPHGSSADIATYVAPLNKVLHDFNLATVTRACAFIAQIAHESGSLRYKEEIASGAAYEGRKDLGNTQPGDGKRFKGRGLIQLTGRSNYRQCGQALNLPLEQNPELVVKDPYTNAAVAAWYWQSRNINAAADKGDFKRVTRLINGGLNGYSDRLQYWERAKKVLSREQGAGSGKNVPSAWSEVNWSDFNAKVSQYFTVREVTNGDRRRIPTDNTIKQNIFTLAQELDKVREAWGSGIIVTSFYRPRLINAQVGGSSQSQHIFGRAADIKPAQGNIYNFQKWLDTNWYGFLGYGAKRGFVHLDNRNVKGWKTGGSKGGRWSY
ncbi:MAG: D-Ala-D-Ala carboxypeptidase family metallohydrolase [Cyanobacteria bacterium P01_G01_bin.49]